MNAQAYQMISIAGFCMAAVMFFVSLTLFFKLRIRRVISSLSGKTASKEIREIREKSSSTEVVKKKLINRTPLRMNSAKTEELPVEETVLLENNTEEGFVLIKNDISIHTKEKIEL